VHKLTKKAEVLAVVKAGGKIGPGGCRGLLRLTDKTGAEVHAWQTALKAAVKHMTSARRSTRQTAAAVTDEAGRTIADKETDRG